MRKNIIKFALALLFVLLFCSSCYSAAVDESLTKVQKRGELIVGVSEANSAPTNFINAQGEWDGFDVQLAGGFAEKLGVKATFKEIGRVSEVPDALDSGEIDCYWSNYTITSDREKQVAFSINYIQCNSVIAVYKNRNINSWDAMKGLTLAYLQGGSAEEAVKRPVNQMNLKEVELKPVATNDELYTGFYNGTYDAIVCDENAIRYKMKDNPLIGIFSLEDDEPYVVDEAYAGVAFARSSYDLKNYTNKYLYQAQRTGKLKNLSIEYFDMDLSVVKL